MPIIIDDSTIKEVLTALGTIGGAGSICVGYLFKRGYIDIWLTKLFTSTEEIYALKKQNGNALAKLNIPDEVLDALQKCAADDEGNIDADKFVSMVHEYIRINKSRGKK